MPANKKNTTKEKKREGEKKSKVLEIKFDRKARLDFVYGFKKRKDERRVIAQELKKYKHRQKQRDERRRKREEINFKLKEHEKRMREILGETADEDEEDSNDNDDGDFGFSLPKISNDSIKLQKSPLVTKVVEYGSSKKQSNIRNPKNDINDDDDNDDGDDDDDKIKKSDNMVSDDHNMNGSHNQRNTNNEEEDDDDEDDNIDVDNNDKEEDDDDGYTKSVTVTVQPISLDDEDALLRDDEDGIMFQGMESEEKLKNDLLENENLKKIRGIERLNISKKELKKKVRELNEEKFQKRQEKRKRKQKMASKKKKKGSHKKKG